MPKIKPCNGRKIDTTLRFKDKSTGSYMLRMEVKTRTFYSRRPLKTL
jgi:hypothetical protein